MVDPRRVTSKLEVARGDAAEAKKGKDRGESNSRVEEDEVEGGDDTEDSEEEPDFWAKYGTIDDSALDEDAEIEI